MGQDTFLGLDIGTSSVKALLIDADQRTVAEASAALDVSRPHPLWSEQNPDDWVEGVEAAVADAAPPRAGGFRPARRRRPLRPDAWRDFPRRRRPAAAPGDPVERRPLLRRMRGADQRASRISSPGRQSGDARLHRAQGACGSPQHEPEVFAATKRILLPKDYVRLRLTGEAVSEMSDAAGTLWLDIAQPALGRGAARRHRASRSPICRRWSRAPTVSGYLSPEIASGLGACGPQDPGRRRRRRQRRVGGRRRGDRGGRGLRLARHVGRHFLGHRAIRQPAAAYAARLLPCAARALARHVGDAVGGGLADLDRPISSGAATTSRPAPTRPRLSPRDPAAVATAPVFLPYLSGERTPYNDPEATGLFAGLRPATAPRRCCLR